MPSPTPIYIFRSITQLTLEHNSTLQELRPSASWMLISLSGSGAIELPQQRTPYRLTSIGALMCDDSTTSIALQKEPGTQAWKLYYIEFDKLDISSGIPTLVREAPHSKPSIFTAPIGDIETLHTMADQLHDAAYMFDDEQERALHIQLLLQRILL